MLQKTVTQLAPQPDELYQSNSLILRIPRLRLTTEIVGVPLSNGEWNITWLGRKAGYLQGSAFPTTPGNTVLTGHVWDADGSQGIFLGLENLRYGDEVRIEQNGLIYIYQVVEVRQYVRPDDIDSIFRHEELDYLTLFTCQRYNEKLNTYDYRILVRSVLVSVFQQ